MGERTMNGNPCLGPNIVGDGKQSVIKINLLHIQVTQISTIKQSGVIGKVTSNQTNHICYYPIVDGSQVM